MATKIKRYFIIVCCLLYSNIVSAQRNKAYTLTQFKLVVCNQLIQDDFIKDILIVDSIKKDTIRATSLLKGDSLQLLYSGTYGIILVGKKKWDYYFQLPLDDGYRGYSKRVVICFDKAAKNTKHSRDSDFRVSFAEQVIGGFTTRIKKR